MTVAWVALANLVTGLVYTTYGLMTVGELRRHWRTRGPSHFGLAWVAMAFTCGPHHVEHAAHLVLQGTAGSLDLVATTVGLPAGLVFFLLRVEAMRDGPGDRPVGDTIGSAVVPGVLGAAGVLVAALTTRVLQDGASWSWSLAPSVALVMLYATIAAALSVTQAHNRTARGTWSLSGLALTAVFATCAAMHGAWLVHVSEGLYEVHGHLLVTDLAAVPAAAYLLWVVARLQTATLPDWNELSPTARRDHEPGVVPTVG